MIDEEEHNEEELFKTAAINFVVDLNDFVEDSLVAFNKAQKLWKSAAGEPGKSGRSHRWA